MTHPLDKFGRDYAQLVATQAAELLHWERVLRPEVYRDLSVHCRFANQPVTLAELEERKSLGQYKSGGLHICPVGSELHHLVMSWGTPAQSDTFVNHKTKQKQVMDTIKKQLAQVLTLLAAIVAAMPDAVAAAAPAAAADPLEALKELAGRKDQSLVQKILKKKLAADSLDELEGDEDIAKATKLIGELDDAEGGNDAEPQGDEPTEVTLETLKDKASEIISAGKSSEIKAVLAKFKVKKISELKEKDFAAVDAALTKLA